MAKNLFFILIAVILLMIAAVIYIKGQDAAREVSIVDNETLVGVENDLPRFEFYTLLPESSVPMPDESGHKSGQQEGLHNDEVNNSPDLSVSDKQYILQIASLSHREEAEKLKQQLFSQGFDAYIEQFNDENVTWYRVRWGPFPSLQAAEHALNELSASNIDNVMLQRVH